jgi:hypothetical protein
MFLISHNGIIVKSSRVSFLIKKDNSFPGRWICSLHFRKIACFQWKRQPTILDDLKTSTKLVSINILSNVHVFQ